MPTSSGRRLTDDSQTRRSVSHILRAHRITIHLRAIERRQIRISNDVLGQHPTQCVLQLNLLGRQRLRLLPDDLNSFRNRNHFACAFVPFVLFCG